MKSKSKNDIFYLILLVLTMITMIVGITFTYFGLIASENNSEKQAELRFACENENIRKDKYALDLIVLQEDWQKHTTAPVASAQHGTFPSVLILSARASHMAKARVKVRKSAHGKVMSREGRKE